MVESDTIILVCTIIGSSMGAIVPIYKQIGQMCERLTSVETELRIRNEK